MKYPELDKIKEASKQSNTIGSFLDWLSEKEIFLTKWEVGDRDRYVQIRESKEELLAEYFEIDLNKAEKERVQILENVRSNN